MRVFIGSVCAQFAGARIHHLAEGVHAARDVFGDGHRRVVARAQHQPIEHIAHGQLLAFGEINRSTRNAFGIGPGGDDLLRRAGFHGEQAGHNFGGGRHGIGRIGILRKEHATRSAVNQHGALGRQGQFLAARRLAGQETREQHHERGQFFHPSTPREYVYARRPLANHGCQRAARELVKKVFLTS